MRGGRDESACALRGSGVTGESESEGWFFLAESWLAESWLAESLKHGEKVMGGGGEKAETLKWHSTLDSRLSTLHFGKIIFWNHNQAKRENS